MEALWSTQGSGCGGASLFISFHFAGRQEFIIETPRFEATLKQKNFCNASYAVKS
jgi:hypothetical protein